MTKITHRRAGRGNNGSHWIGYSDMMASLLLVFVLTLCYSMYLYFSTLETKTAELEEQRAVVAAQQSTLDEQTVRLEAQTAQLAQQQEDLESAQASLAEQQAALDAANETLASREEELASLQSQLAQQQITLDAQAEVLASQQEALESQTAKIDDLVGVRTQIVSELSSALTASGLKATVDPNSGDITLDSAVFFETASYTIKADGQAMLDQFVPVYLSVLLQDKYKDYLGQIIIEGHTDTVGEYFMNLELSQNRALSVAKYCLQMRSLTEEQREMLRSILTAQGRSYADPIYNADGTVNMEQSRRVEFKFSLRDAEMIEEMNRILQGQ
ncbi:MAG TPA: OmpA family protein [Candidatus Egerieenecus merdigallinarum]|nr:OmpA family protein [Candidatus Egerieenecus merdigallinarum]